MDSILLICQYLFKIQNCTNYSPFLSTMRMENVRTVENVAQKCRTMFMAGTRVWQWWICRIKIANIPCNYTKCYYVTVRYFSWYLATNLYIKSICVTLYYFIFYQNLMIFKFLLYVARGIKSNFFGHLHGGSCNKILKVGEK